MQVTSESMRLYAVTDRSWLGEKTLYEQVEMALKGGATFVQLREKNLSYDEFLAEANRIAPLCRSYGVPFVINDNVEIALACNADGVHVGQEDMSAVNARRMLGPDKIVGVSTHNVSEAIQAEKDGADYIGAGAAFVTSTKDVSSHLTYDVLKSMCKAVSIPVVAIGGIKESNMLQLKGSGIDGVAIVSAIFAQPDITEACKRLRKLSEEVSL